MNLEILHVLGSARPEAVSVVRQVLRLARDLPPRIRLHAWFLMGDGPLRAELEAAGVQTRVVPWEEGARQPLAALRFWRSLASHRFDAVHTHVGGRLLHSLVRVRRSRLVIHLHGRDPEGSVLPIATYLRRADRVIAVSEAVAEWSRDPRCHVIYPGVDLEPAVVPRARNGRFTIGCAARLAPEKGLSSLIDAVAALRSGGLDVGLQIAGDGPEGQALRTRAERHGLPGETFLGWRGDVRERMLGWDVFVLPSLHEGLSSALLEAMAAGLPVVVSRTGGIPECIEDGRTGLLVAPGNRQEIETAVRRLIEDEPFARRLGAAARSRVEAFDGSRMSIRFLEVYDELLGGVTAQGPAALKRADSAGSGA